MPSHNQPRIVLITLAVAVGTAISAFLFHGVLGHWLAGATGTILTPVSDRLGYGKALVQVLLGHHDLMLENTALRAEVERAQAAVARVGELEQENQFLRASVGLAERVGHTLIDAGVFAYVKEGGVRQMTVNKGTRDWVAVGDVVLTENGSLVGIVIETYTEHSVVRTLGDLALEVTGHIADTQVSGLVRVDAKEGLLLDLVEQGEQVTEGQRVVTGGNDQFPGGLVIGTVRSVDSDRATLFQVVRITPVISQTFSGRVFITHR